MVYTKFEDMPVWLKAKELTLVVYRVTQAGKFSKDFGLRDQIRRASVSVMSNIAEGCERNSAKEFIMFLSYARGSVGEVRNQLIIAVELEYIGRQQFQELYDCCFSISKQLTSFMQFLKNKSNA